MDVTYLPVAAGKIACGVHPSEAGAKKHGLVDLPLRPLSIGAGRVECSVVHIDIFGMSSSTQGPVDLREAGLAKRSRTKIWLELNRGRSVALRFAKTYHEVGKGEFIIWRAARVCGNSCRRRVLRRVRRQAADRLRITD